MVCIFTRDTPVVTFAMSSTTAITVTEVTRTFPMKQRHTSLLGRITSGQLWQLLLRKEQPMRTVLDAISLEVPRGQTLGVIGRNASGKTTLLQMIAGIQPPDAGAVEVQGRIVPLLHLGAGLMPRLSVHDNIRLLCFFYGMSRCQVDDVYDEIIEFGELEEYVGMQPNQLSRGTLQRLLFTIAVHTKPDILLLDEVFATGDVVFCKKAVAKMKDIIHGTATVILVSHNLKLIKESADRVVWLEEGVLRMIGTPDEVVAAYQGECAKQ